MEYSTKRDSQIPVYQQVIDEIGTQTLARFGLNIFNLNTYNSYAASTLATDNVMHSYDRHHKNPQAFGYIFEDLDVGKRNISSSLHDNGNKTYTTDELANIRKVSDIISSGKKIENLNAKDRASYDFVMQHYLDEVKAIKTNPNMYDNAHKNDPSTDTITFDAQGNIVEKSQLKVIKNTDSLLKDRYLNNNDSIRVPFDDYVKHKHNLEEKLNNPDITKAEKQKINLALEKLEASNSINRSATEHARMSAITTQGKVAVEHIAQAGFSDGVVFALSTLASGAIFEIKDILSNGESVSIQTRIKRLLKKVIDDFSQAFKRGASFGSLDIAVDLLSQIFKSFSGKLKALWNNLRTAAKSIFNAIWEFTTGKITNFQDLITIIIKGLFSAIMVVGSITLESKLELFLASVLPSAVASVVASALAIVIGAIAVVFATRSIESALNVIFSTLAQEKAAQIRLEKIQSICNEMLPNLIEDNQALRRLITETYQKRRLSFDKSFDQFKEGLSKNDYAKMVEGLIGINSMYGKSLQYTDFDEFNCMMLDEDSVFEF